MKKTFVVQAVASSQVASNRKPRSGRKSAMSKTPDKMFCDVKPVEETKRAHDPEDKGQENTEEAEIMPKGKTERLSHFPGITPLHAVRFRCLDCCGYLQAEVKNCPIKDCPLYPYRMRTGRIKLRVIRQNCLECMGGSPDNVKSCTDKNCSLFPFRFGKNPNISEKTRELRRKQSKSLDNYRKSQKHVAVLKEPPSECD